MNSENGGNAGAGLGSTRIKLLLCIDPFNMIAYIVIEEVAADIGNKCRTLPTFEKGLFDYMHRKHNSLQTNEYLLCHWRQYVQNFDKRVFAPFQFVDVRDYHFYNCDTRLIPSKSVHKNQNFRFKLKTGPGVDLHGQMPIPQDLLMKRGVQKVVRPKKLIRTSKNPNYQRTQAINGGGAKVNESVPAEPKSINK